MNGVEKWGYQDPGGEQNCSSATTGLPQEGEGPITSKLCVKQLGLAHMDLLLLLDQGFLISIDKPVTQVHRGQCGGMHQAASSMLSSDIPWTASGLLYAHSNPGILSVQEYGQINQKRRAKTYTYSFLEMHRIASLRIQLTQFLLMFGLQRLPTLLPSFPSWPGTTDTSSTFLSQAHVY